MGLSCPAGTNGTYCETRKRLCHRLRTLVLCLSCHQGNFSSASIENLENQISELRSEVTLLREQLDAGNFSSTGGAGGAGADREFRFLRSSSAGAVTKLWFRAFTTASLGDLPSNPATSCRHLLQIRPDAPTVS